MKEKSKDSCTNGAEKTSSREGKPISPTTPYRLRVGEREIAVSNTAEGIRRGLELLDYRRGPDAPSVILEVGPHLFLSPTWRDLTEADVRSFLMEELKWRLSASHYNDFREHGLDIAAQPARKKICDAIDDFILYAVVLCGPAIFLLPEVLQRMADWGQGDEAGVERCESFARQFALLPKVYRGGAHAPLNPWWVRARRLIVKEVKALRNSLLETAPDGDLLTIAERIETSPEKFPTLQRMGDAFMAFAASHTEAVKALLDKKLTPAKFTDELVGWYTNYEPESSRQTIQKHLRTKVTTSNL